MNTRINERGFDQLFGRDGPVTEDLVRRAENVVNDANLHIATILENPMIRPEPDYVVTDQGVVIGIRDEGSVARYMAAKEVRESVWLVPALIYGIRL